MIRLFGINDIDFRSNGERIIRARKAEVYRDIDGEYKLYLQAPLDERIENNSIIVAPTPWGEQPFRVYTVESGMYSRTIYARHIFFDAMNYLLDDVAPTDKDAKDALEWILARTDSPNYFTADSDILDIKTTRHVNKSLYDAVHDLAKAYGGYVVPDGFQIGIYSSLGADKGVTIRYGKNLKGISATENWDNVCTKLLPIGHEGIELPEKYVEADVQYDIPYSRTIRFNPSMGINVTDEEALIEDLRAQAEEYVEANKYPQVNYTVEAFEENVDLGDTIHVLHEKADIDILTTVISITYDCIRQQAIRIEFGNFRPSIKGLAKTINETQKSVETEKIERVAKTTALEKALEQSEKTIMDYLTKGHKYITENAIYFLDNQDPSLAEHVMMMSLGGIAFGEQGINGPFTTAWDIEGNFNAQFITSGTMSADRVRTGKIVSEDNKVVVDLDNREVNFDEIFKIEKNEFDETVATLAGWTLTPEEIRGTYATLATVLKTPTHLADVVFQAGDAESPSVRIFAWGKLEARNAEIKGSVSATAFEVLNGDGDKIGGLYGTGVEAYLAAGRLVNPQNITGTNLRVGIVDGHALDGVVLYRNNTPYMTFRNGSWLDDTFVENDIISIGRRLKLTTYTDKTRTDNPSIFLGDYTTTYDGIMLVSNQLYIRAPSGMTIEDTNVDIKQDLQVRNQLTVNNMLTASGEIFFKGKYLYVDPNGYVRGA